MPKTRLLGLLGALGCAALLLANDPMAIVGSTMAIGIGGFILIIGWQLLLYIPLGAAWHEIDRSSPLENLIWARAVRESASNCLPFSVVGGIFFGARARAANDASLFQPAIGSSIVDATLEFVAQIGFAAAALACLSVQAPRSVLLLPMLGGLLVAGFVALLAMKGSARLAAMASRLARKFGAGLADGEIHELFRSLYGNPRALLCGVGYHALGWIGSAAGLWLVLRLLGHPVSAAAAVAIEGGLCLVRAAAFSLPGALGVQEAGYAALGAIYGVPVETTLAVSLLRRAREISVGLPVLVLANMPARRVSGSASPQLIAKGFSIANRILDRFPLWEHSPAFGSVLTAVAGEPGWRALNAPEVREGVWAWTESLRAEANLNPLGRYAAHWDVVRLLRIQCRLADEEARDPSILAEPIEAPIFITGMPRSGSTFLHGVLAQDPANAVPSCWQAMAPYPCRHGRDTRQAEARFQLGMFNRLSPGLSALHPLSIETPQECSELMAASFRSLRFDTTHDVPGYRRWLDQSGHMPAYAFLRRMLQHLQRQQGRRQWVLKCPDHVFAMDALLANFPDARIVVMHRDPLKVLPSAAKLTELLRKPFTSHIDRPALGAHVVRDWRDGARRIVALGNGPVPQRLMHIHYREITGDPMGTVARLYDRFGLRPAAEAEAAFDRACQRPRGGYGQNRYRFDEFAIDPGLERERFQSYMRAFDVEPEVKVPWSRPSRSTRQLSLVTSLGISAA